MAAPKMKQAPPADANIRQVAPYPISVQITKVEGTPPVMGAIVRLIEIGFLMKIDATQFYKVGETLHFRFELPATHVVIQGDGKIIKTYDAFETVGRSQVKMHTIEVHFKALSVDQRTHIENYLVQSGQKKR